MGEFCFGAELHFVANELLKMNASKTSDRHPVIVWFRLDLRTADNPALQSAIVRGRPVVPLFIHCPKEDGQWASGGASNWWLHQSLTSLEADLRHIGSKLIIRCGSALQVLRTLIAETGASGVVWNRRYEPELIARDTEVKRALIEDGSNVETYNAALLFEPWTVQNKSGKPFQVFTPYWKHCMLRDDPIEPFGAPANLLAPPDWPYSEKLDSLKLESSANGRGRIGAQWKPGAKGAKKALNRFLANAFDEYNEQRNRPDIAGTSRLSPHLHFGEIGPRQIWNGLSRMAKKRGLPEDAWHASQFVAEIGWREFSHHLLYHFPATPLEPLRENFKRFPWREEPEWLQRWQRGRTGYPIVDAGMRELWTTGWMHNRVRMIVASFLVKDLLISWQEGARWFWDTLVDADLAQNTLGWQWTAGCGADAAPFFRVFNPVSQGEKFDPNGDYVSKWCPELAGLPAKWIHQPHRAPVEVLRAAMLDLGRTYPTPIVNHSIAREVALEAFAKTKR